MKEELYESILDLLVDNVGFKCQMSELEDTAKAILDKIREAFEEELM